MRGVMAVLLAAAALVGLTSCASMERQVTAPPPDTLRIATHNVHYIWLERAEGPWSVGDWEARKGAMDAAFKALDADLVGFQEMESFGRTTDPNTNLARDWLLAQNPGYAAAASGDARTFPSTQPILYRKDRLELLDQGWFFFSDTPDVIYSRTFNGSFPAFASWARFSADGVPFRVLNMHNDYASRSNRVLSSDLIAARIRPWLAAGERVIVMGDFNSLRWGAPVQIVAEEGVRFLPVQGATYHLDRGLHLFGAIDHIGLSDGLTAIGETQVLRQSYGGVYPSDHYPVVADIRLE